MAMNERIYTHWFCFESRLMPKSYMQCALDHNTSGTDASNIDRRRMRIVIPWIWTSRCTRTCKQSSTPHHRGTLRSSLPHTGDRSRQRVLEIHSETGAIRPSYLTAQPTDCERQPPLASPSAAPPRMRSWRSPAIRHLKKSSATRARHAGRNSPTPRWRSSKDER
jgi:hypothetical protein